MDTARPAWSDGRSAVAVHQSSVNHMQMRFKHRFLVFHDKVKTSKVFLRDCTVVSPYALLLFGGPITVKVRDNNLNLFTVWA
jgi:ATP-dependent RNA helicase DHX29